MKSLTPYRRQPSYVRRLSFEQFETRLLLTSAVGGLAEANPAPADIGGEVNDQQVAAPLARFRIQATDVSGQAISGVSANEPFLLHVYVSDLRKDPQGVFAAYLDLHFDSALVERTGSATFGEWYSNLNRLDASAPGLLNEVGAFSNSLDPLGDGEFLLVTIPFLAQSEGTVSFVAEPADLEPDSLVLLYGSYSPVNSGQIEFASTVFESRARPPSSLAPPPFALLPVPAAAAADLVPTGFHIAEYLAPLLPPWLSEELHRFHRESVARGPGEFADREIGNAVSQTVAASSELVLRLRIISYPERSFHENATNMIELPIVTTGGRSLPPAGSTWGHLPAERVIVEPGESVRPSWKTSIVNEGHWLRLGFLRAAWGDRSEESSREGSWAANEPMFDLAEIAYEVIVGRAVDALPMDDDLQDERIAALRALAAEEVAVDGAQGVAMVLESEANGAQDDNPPEGEAEQPEPDRLPAEAAKPRGTTEKRGPTHDTTPAA